MIETLGFYAYSGTMRLRIFPRGWDRSSVIGLLTVIFLLTILVFFFVWIWRGGKRYPVSDSSLEACEIPVTVLPTRLGFDPQNDGDFLSYPAMVTVTLPADYCGELSAYGAAGEISIGPKAWTGEGSVGASGNRTVTLFPYGKRDKTQMVFFWAGPGTGSAIIEAAPYFPWILSRADEFGIPRTIAARDFSEVSHLTPSLVRFTVSGLNSEWETRGVAYSNAEKVGKNGVWEFVSLEITLPADQEQLAGTLCEV